MRRARKLYMVTPTAPCALGLTPPDLPSGNYSYLTHLHITNSFISLNVPDDYWRNQHSFVNTSAITMRALTLCPRIHTLVWEWQRRLLRPPGHAVAFAVFTLRAATSMRHIKITGLRINPRGDHFLTNEQAYLKDTLPSNALDSVQIIEFDACNRAAIHSVLSRHPFPDLKSLKVNGERMDYHKYGGLSINFLHHRDSTQYSPRY